jgi:hypothetical protein
MAPSCNSQTGVCSCKSGYAGDKCNVCPDGTLVGVTGCAGVKNRSTNPSTRYNILT